MNQTPQAAMPGILERLLSKFSWYADRWKQLQWWQPQYNGGTTIRVFTGDASGGTGPQQGQSTYSNQYRVCIDPAANTDALCDITIWSRGAVATNGTVTQNSTSILVEQEGGPVITLAQGDVITLSKKSPRRHYIKAGAQPASTDSVVVWW